MTSTQRPGWQTAVAVALGILGGTTAVAGTAAVAGAGFTLSFDAIRAVGVAAHMREDWAWMFPVSVDGAMAVATVVAVVTYRLTGRHHRYPWAVLILGAVISMVCNGVHATGDLGAPLDLPVEVRVPVSAVPALMVTLAVHLMVTLVSVVSDIVSGHRDTGHEDTGHEDTEDTGHEDTGHEDTEDTGHEDTEDTGHEDTGHDVLSSLPDATVSLSGTWDSGHVRDIPLDTDIDMESMSALPDMTGPDMDMDVRLSDADMSWLSLVSRGGVLDTTSPAVPIVSGALDSGPDTDTAPRVQRPARSDWDKDTAVAMLAAGHGAAVVAAAVFGEDSTAAHVKRVQRLRADMDKLTPTEFQDKHGVPLPPEALS